MNAVSSSYNHGSFSLQGNAYSYRYAFNGMEKDDEIKGEGNFYDFGARMFDPRLGRWLSIDPLARKQPSQSPYKAFLNSPIIFSDPDGKDEYLRIVVKDERSGLTYVSKSKKISQKVMTDGTGSPHIHSNNFYDFETTITIKIDKEGKSTPYLSYDFLYKNGLKDFDLANGTAGEKGKYYNKTKSDGFFWGVTIDLKGKGGTQAAGVVYTSDSGGDEHTKQRALTPSEEINMESLLIYFGAGQRSLYPDIPKNTDVLKDLTNDGKAIVESGKALKDQSEKAKDEDAGIQSSRNGPNSNKTYWTKGEDGKYHGERPLASQKEMKSGDTLGGKPDVNVYPKK